MVWTNMKLIMFVFVFFFFFFFLCFALASLLLVQMSPFKMSAVKGGSSKGKEPVIDVDNLSLRPKRARSPTGVYDLEKFRFYATFQNYERYLKTLRCWLRGLLTKNLYLKPKSLNGLPPRIGTSFFPTLMMLTRTWWKSFMLMPFQKERSSNVGLEENVSRWH